MQTNVNVSGEDYEKLLLMMKDDGFDNRSAFIRKLIRTEYQRRAYNSNNSNISTEIEQTASNTRTN